MQTIRIRLTKDQKNKLQRIAERDHRSLTGTIRNWIDCDSAPQQAHELFNSREYIKKA